MTEPTPERKALDYAENVLGVHSVYADATTARTTLERVQKDLLNARNRRRQLETYLHDREMVVAEEIHQANAKESQAARDRLTKVAVNNDGDIRETRDDLATLAGEIDHLDFEVDRLTVDIKIAVARMQELGGHLQFLAVIKQAQQSSQPPPTDGNPWT